MDLFAVNNARRIADHHDRSSFSPRRRELQGRRPQLLQADTLYCRPPSMSMYPKQEAQASSDQRAQKLWGRK